jgi:hypothetical protein
MKKHLPDLSSLKLLICLFIQLLFSSYLFGSGNLEIQVISKDHIKKGNILNFTVYVSNSGPDDMTDVLVRMALLNVSAFTANAIVLCESGLANNGSSVCPSANLTYANLTNAGIVIPSLPDGGSVTLTFSGEVGDNVSDSTFITANVVVSAAPGQTDIDPSNNESSFRTIVHPLTGGDSTYYRISSLESQNQSDPVGADGGNFKLVFNRTGGAAVTGLGDQFSVNCTYSELINRAGGNNTWNYFGQYIHYGNGDAYSFIVSLMPNSGELFQNLPTNNAASFLYGYTDDDDKVMGGDFFYRKHLSTNTIDPLGVFYINIGALPTLPSQSTSILVESYLDLAGTFNTQSSAVVGLPEVNLDWGHWISPTGLNYDKGDYSSTGVLEVPFNNKYSFRYTALLPSSKTAPTEGQYMSGNRRWADIASWEVVYWARLDVLPIGILNFNAVAQNEASLLTWSITEGLKNQVFEVERSADGNTWESIGYVATEVNKNNYQFTDLQPLQGVNHYRLKQKGTDGKIDYSTIKTARFGNITKVSVYPNPTTQYVIVDGIKGNEKMSLFDANGKHVKTIWALRNMITIGLDELSNGIYYLHVFGENKKVDVHKIVKLK